MITRVQKWGNSLGLRIPKSFAKEALIEAGSLIDLTLEQGKLTVTSLTPPAYLLDDLLARVTRDNLPGEVDWGAPAGREVW
jgi:antitoxin MazE